MTVPGPAGATSGPSTPAASASPPPTALPSAPVVETGPRSCGCSLCEPIVSDDACTTNADCAPSQPCHAPKCVAIAKAVLRKPNDMCTQMLACMSADSNDCGCVLGKCTLAPRKK